MNDYNKEKLTLSNICTSDSLKGGGLRPYSYICGVTIECINTKGNCSYCSLGTTRIKDTVYDIKSCNRNLALEAVLTTIILN